MSNARELVEISGTTDCERVLYAIPHAGAGVAAVKGMCRALGARWSTVGVRLAGRESRTSETPVNSLRLLADGLAAHIGEHAKGRRIHLYGHCSGALLAYEVALRLPASELEGLTVSAHQSPDRVPLNGAWRLPRDQFFVQVRKDGYLPDELIGNTELLELVEPALRADYEAIETHPFEPRPLDMPLLALLGSKDDAVEPADAVLWEQWTTDRFCLDTLPGGHNLLLDDPEQVAAAISSFHG
ncbi:alpha/beta fold hydrolase [Streptomyces sp. NPDC050610]|uniref:thioesterase II family protein n=1 Tax=Streptomyces sp. NPDC050610 TaxID=3157097 RepID=UPI00342D1EB3